MPHTRDAIAAQGELPLSRESRLATLRGLHFALPGRRGLNRRLIPLLIEIELTSGADGCCRLTQEVLAARLSIAPRTLRDLIPLARKLGILHVEPTIIGGRGPCGYRIDYDGCRRFARPLDRPAVSAGRAAETAGRAAESADRPANKASPCASLNDKEGLRVGGLEGSSLSSAREEKTPSNLAGQRRIPRADWQLWKAECFSANLPDPAAAERVYRLAVELKLVADDLRHRMLVYAEAAKAVRMARDKTVKHPRLVLATNVLQHRWNASDADDDAARRMIAAADGRPRQTGRDRYLGSLQADNDAANKRQESKAALERLANSMRIPK